MSTAEPPVVEEDKKKKKKHHGGHKHGDGHHHHQHHAKDGEEHQKHHHKHKKTEKPGVVTTQPTAVMPLTVPPTLGPAPVPGAAPVAQMTPPPVAHLQMSQPPRLVAPPSLIAPPPVLAVPAAATAAGGGTRSRHTSTAPQPTTTTTTADTTAAEPAPKFTQLRPWLESHHIGGETGSALLHAGVPIERLTALDDAELVSLGMPLCARLDVYGAVWLSSKWLPRTPAKPLTNAPTPAKPLANATAPAKPAEKTPAEKTAEQQAAPEPATAPTIAPPIGMRTSVLTPSKLAPPPRLALPTMPVPKTVDEMLEESLVIHESAVSACQGLLSTTIARRFYTETGSPRLAAVVSLADLLTVYAGNFAAYSSIVANPAILGEELAKHIASFTGIGRAWSKLSAEIHTRAQRWTRKSLVSEILLGAADSWVASIKFFISTRGQHLFALQAKAKKTPKLASFFLACKGPLAKQCKDVDTFVEPLAAFEEWTSRQLRGLTVAVGRLLDATHVDHPDHAQLAILAKQITELQAIDVELRAAEEGMHINAKAVEAAVERMSAAPEDIVSWGRALVEEGTVAILRGKRGTEMMHYFLFSDLFVIGMQEGKKTRVTEAIGITTATLRDVPDGTDLAGVSAKNVWAAENVFIVAKTPEEKQTLFARVTEVARTTKEQQLKDRERIASLQHGHVVC